MGPPTRPITRRPRENFNPARRISRIRPISFSLTHTSTQISQGQRHAHQTTPTMVVRPSQRFYPAHRSHHGNQFAILKDGNKYAILEAYEGWSFTGSRATRAAAERGLETLAAKGLSHEWDDAGTSVTVKDVDWGSATLVGRTDHRDNVQGSIKVGDPTPSLAEGPLDNLDSLFPPDLDMGSDDPSAGAGAGDESDDSSLSSVPPSIASTSARGRSFHNQTNDFEDLIIDLRGNIREDNLNVLEALLEGFKADFKKQEIAAREANQRMMEEQRRLTLEAMTGLKTELRKFMIQGFNAQQRNLQVILRAIQGTESSTESGGSTPASSTSNPRQPAD